MRFTGNLAVIMLALSGIEALSIPLRSSVVRIPRFNLSYGAVSVLIADIPIRMPFQRHTTHPLSDDNLKSAVLRSADLTVALAVEV